MARQNRRDIFDANEVGCFHAIQRTVRRAWLCGLDPVSGKSFEHRRTWIQNRLQELAASFGIDCLSFAVMVNHIHVILRNRPDIVAGWSDEEVARHWWKLFPLRKIFRRFGIVSIQSPKPWLLDASVYPIHRSPCKRSVPMSILGGLGWKSVLRTTHKPVEMGDVNFG